MFTPLTHRSLRVFHYFRNTVEELFIDYGPSFDRRDYSQNLSPPIPEKSDDADGKRLRIQPIVLSKDSAESNQSDIPVSPSPARRDSFLGQLTAHEAKYAKSGILSPVEASKRFNMQGEAIFASAEDQQLIDSLYGKPTKTTTITTPTAADVAKSAGVDTLIPDSLVGRLLDRNIVDSVDILAAGKDDAVVDIGIGKSRSKVSAGPKIARSSIFDQRRPRDTLSPERASVSEVQNPTMEVLGGSSSDPIMGPEQAASLQRKLDSLSDEEVEEVFRRLSSTAMQKLVQQGLQRRKNVRKNVGSALSNSEDTSSNNSNDASSITSGSTSGTPLSVPPLDATVREKYEAELGEVQKVLEELREDPMALWRELLQNPEKYTDEDGNPLPTS